MKATFAVLVIAAIAGAHAFVGTELPTAGPAGSCPEVDGRYPVYLSDLKNRYVFYECSNGRAILQACNSGLLFNPAKNVCDYQQQEAFGPVGECPQPEGEFPTFLRDGRDLSTLYMCVDGAPVRMRCADGLVFDPYRGACFTN